MSDQAKSDQFALSPELASLQARLAQLTPAAPRVDRDQLMFDAGRAAERAGSWEQGAGSRIGLNVCATGSASARFWPAATATMTAATVLLATMLVWQNGSQPIAHERAIPDATVKTETADVPPTRIGFRSTAPRLAVGYLGVRDAALSRGFGSLANEFNGVAPDAKPKSEPATARQLLEELLPEAAEQRS